MAVQPLVWRSSRPAFSFAPRCQAWDVIGRLAGVIQQRHGAVVIGVQDGIIFMSVALATVHGQGDPRGAGDTDAVHHGIEAILIRIDAALFIEHGVAMITVETPGPQAWPSASCRQQSA